MNYSLKDARIAKGKGDYIKAEEIYNEIYKEDPFKFRFKHLQNYAYVIYENHIKGQNTEDIIEYANFITTITSQLKNGRGFCVYSVTVIDIMKFLNKNNRQAETIKWSNKLNPKLLNVKPFKSDTGTIPSDREKYYSHLTRALFELTLYPQCIQLSKEALESCPNMISEDFLKWNMVKSYFNEGQFDEALVCLKEIEYLDKWFFYHKFAEIYYQKDNIDMALKYALKAVLDDEPPIKKFNLYKTLIRILMKKGFNEEILKHEYLIYSIKKQFHNFDILQDALKQEFLDNDFDIENVDAYKTEAELKGYWAKLQQLFG